MNPNARSFALLLGVLLIPVLVVVLSMASAKKELALASDQNADVAVASAAEDDYCSPKLKQILRRVAGACGLLAGGARGCKPTDAKTVAALSGEDFNQLFLPMEKRAGIIQFDAQQTDLDPAAQALVESAWSEQGGASFFFVVARASSDGKTIYNQELSAARAQAVLAHLRQKFNDPDLEREVGLLWLGEEYAQLSRDFCNWRRSREAACTPTEINRSAFVAWIDCTI